MSLPRRALSDLALAQLDAKLGKQYGPQACRARSLALSKVRKTAEQEAHRYDAMRRPVRLDVAWTESDRLHRRARRLRFLAMRWAARAHAAERSFK